MANSLNKNNISSIVDFYGTFSEITFFQIGKHSVISILYRTKFTRPGKSAVDIISESTLDWYADGYQRDILWLIGCICTVIDDVLHGKGANVAAMDKRCIHPQ